MIIGVTGKSGVGKNYFAETICKQNENIVHIDIDIIGHFVLGNENIIRELTSVFGDEIVSDKNIDRKKLAELVFNNRKKYSILSEIMWSKMEEQIDSILTDKSKDYILNWILLPKTKYFNMCDIKYLIIADEEKRIEDVLKRDGITLSQLNERDKNSMQYKETDFNFIVKGVRK